MVNLLRKKTQFLLKVWMIQICDRWSLFGWKGGKVVWLRFGFGTAITTYPYPCSHSKRHIWSTMFSQTFHALLVDPWIATLQFRFWLGSNLHCNTFFAFRTNFNLLTPGNLKLRLLVLSRLSLVGHSSVVDTPFILQPFLCLILPQICLLWSAGDDLRLLFEISSFCRFLKNLFTWLSSWDWHWYLLNILGSLHLFEGVSENIHFWICQFYWGKAFYLG